MLLGHSAIPASQLPLTATQVEQLAVNKITPTVGGVLFEHGFKPPLPPLPTPPLDDKPCNLGELLATTHPMAALEAQHSLAKQQAAQAKESVSLVICTRDRPDDLQRCLASLHHLTRRPDQVIVVDNAPRDQRTRQLVAGHPDIEYVLEAQPGLSRARNAGIACCRGDIIAFTDDDVIVHPDWLLGMLHGFDKPDVQAVTGPILPAELETESQLLFQLADEDTSWGHQRLLFDAGFFAATQGKGAPVWHIGAGANMAFRREVFEQVGLFDDRLGAGASGCSEDSEMWYRILAEGGECRYEPTALVFHVHRSDLSALNHQMHQYMRGHVAALLMQWERYGHRGNVYRALGALPLWYGQQALHWALRGGKPRPTTLGRQITGCIAGLLFFWKHRRPRHQARHLNATPSTKFGGTRLP
jgi:GT2 family glycosyltransferase